jgi:hypothetical protein
MVAIHRTLFLCVFHFIQHSFTARDTTVSFLEMDSFSIHISKSGIMHKLQTHLRKHSAVKLNKICGKNNFKIVSAQQGRIFGK